MNRAGSRDEGRSRDVAAEGEALKQKHRQQSTRKQSIVSGLQLWPCRKTLCNSRGAACPRHTAARGGQLLASSLHQHPSSLPEQPLPPSPSQRVLWESEWMEVKGERVHISHCRLAVFPRVMSISATHCTYSLRDRMQTCWNSFLLLWWLHTEPLQRH